MDPLPGVPSQHCRGGGGQVVDTATRGSAAVGEILVVHVLKIAPFQSYQLLNINIKYLLFNFMLIISNIQIFMLIKYSKI